MSDATREAGAALLIDPKKRRRAFEEYDVLVRLIGDTGRDIWVINGAYILVVGALLSSLLTKENVGPTSATGLLLRGSLGALLSLLWWASFERNYAFYSYRIRLARSLERALNFRPFVGGDELGRNGRITVLGEGRPIVMWVIGRVGSIQWLTRTAIWIFLTCFLIAAYEGLSELTSCRGA
jgi:hypothetical protein